MKLCTIIIPIMLLVFLFCACRQTEDITLGAASNAEMKETDSAMLGETSWQDRFEYRSTDTVVAELKEHFAENQVELEKIALAMFRDERNYSCKLYAQRGVLYAEDPTAGQIDFSNRIESETAELIADYYAKGFSENQDIFIDSSFTYIKNEVCTFSYTAFLEDDGVLTEVDLLYSEQENPIGCPPAEYIALDDNWVICIVSYAY